MFKYMTQQNRYLYIICGDESCEKTVFLHPTVYCLMCMEMGRKSSTIQETSDGRVLRRHPQRKLSTCRLGNVCDRVNQQQGEQIKKEQFNMYIELFFKRNFKKFRGTGSSSI